MSVQITVRIPDSQAEHLDHEVAAGRAGSRAEFLAKLLARDAQERQAIADLVKLLKAGVLPEPYPDLAGLSAFTVHRPLDLD